MCKLLPNINIKITSQGDDEQEEKLSTVPRTYTGKRRILVSVDIEWR